MKSWRMQLRGPSLSHGNHQLTLNLADELPVVQDPRAVSEVVFTLVDNAAKYSPIGLNIVVTAQPADNSFLEVAVESAGEGIPVALRERVFDKFFRATRDGDISEARRPKGSGMGLAVARGIVEAHGGLIWIEDGTERRATRVAFTLPVAGPITEPNTFDSPEASAV